MPFDSLCRQAFGFTLCLAAVLVGLGAAAAKPASDKVAINTASARKAESKKADLKKADLNKAISKKAEPQTAVKQSFAAFVEGLWPEAQRAGVSRATFDAAFKGVTLDASILKHTVSQSEFVRPVWSYLAGAVSEARVRKGQAQASEWSETIGAVERRYGVEGKAVMGIWGLETNFGSNAGGTYVIRSLATLAHARYRDDFFRKELIIALLILEQGHIERAEMLGSWAGAMGQTQFMPSSFIKYAVDFNGGGAKDIWTSKPDALASTANYLKQFGWKSGIPWGCEASLPANFDVSLADRKTRRSISAWRSLGVTPLGEIPSRAEASLFLPAGAEGPAFLITENFDVIKKYNNSDAYALGVSLLGDRIYGGNVVQGPWPTHLKPLSQAESIEVQKRLVAHGYPLEKIDGKLGESTREAIRGFQLKHAMVADGYPTMAVLARLRGDR